MQPGPPIALVRIDGGVQDLISHGVHTLTSPGGTRRQSAVDVVGNPEEKLLHAHDDITTDL